MTEVVSDTLVVILGGGRGNRLFPLTKTRSKPAVPLGGKYRLIDIPISNCIHSRLNRIFVLTQFNSASLNQHVARTYNFDSFSQGFVDVLAAEQTQGSSEWFQGTADAVRKVFPHIEHQSWKYILILSGDHLYRMNYAKMLAAHVERGADVSVGVVPVTEERAPEFGLMKIDANSNITNFREKPPREALDPFREDASSSGTSPALPFLGSMGIYVFNREELVSLLSEKPEMNDFGSQVIPHCLGNSAVSAYRFDDYWEDIGTIKSYFEANLSLCSLHPPFQLFHPTHPIFTRQRHLAGSVVLDSQLSSCIVNDGCLIQGASVSGSVVGLRTRIEPGAVIEDSLLLGADYYPEPLTEDSRMGIGQNARIRYAIIDKNAYIGPNVCIRNEKGIDEYDDPAGRYYIRSGIVIVSKGARIEAGTVI